MGRNNMMTKFLEDIVDDTKTFVDDLIDRATDVEGNARATMKDVVDDDETSERERSEMEKVRRSLDDLRRKVDQLASSGTGS